MSGEAIFSREEFAGRLAALQEAMAERDLDLVILDQGEALFHLTGYAVSRTRYRACLVPRQGEPVYVLRSLDLGHCKEQIWFEQALGFADWEDPLEAVAGVIREQDWDRGRIGLDHDSTELTVKDCRRYENLLPGVAFVDIMGLLPKLRACKSAEELVYLRKSAAVADSAMAAVVAQAATGGSARDAARTAADVYYKEGADNGFVGPVTAVRGTDAAFLHPRLTDDPLAEGDILHTELIPRVHGYCARIMRPTVIGTPTAEQEETARHLIAIQDRQIAAMRPGVPAAEVDGVLREGFKAAGLASDLDNITGYTVGLYMPWTPRTSDFTGIFLPDADWPLEPGMTFHMYAAAAGLGFSETVLVTEEGPERLTRTERRLFKTAG